MMHSKALILMLDGALILFALMFLAWLIHLRVNNAGVVDLAWTLALPILAVFYAFATYNGAPSWRMWLLAAMVSVWGLRLALHLIFRIAREPEDGRYQQIRKDWTGNIKLKFLFFFEFQALIDVALSIPFVIVALDSSAKISTLEYIGVALWVCALIGESVADHELAAFKRDPKNHGQVCENGLWNYSRHPNYFFEWFVWVAWAVYAWPSHLGWLGLFSPILMFLFLYRVTGIPMTEAQSVRSRGDRYRRYQQTTSAFVPWFKKHAEAAQ